ncbi:MAG: YihA family ribosome biogenesis GTP-binding protein [Schwartzia sp.]|nr:YihA family ribosome biogenesis GTP-binding protein [Schwartzia sp. (in: firmicutes)]
MRERIVITRGQYLTSAVNREQYPAEDRPEIVFIGRSNVGKSSLINSLTRVKNLAHVSSQPGKTQTINFYEVGMKIEDDAVRRDFYFVDLPGYGYAKVGKTQRMTWKKFIEEYLLSSQNIRFVAQLIDIRHDPMQSDQDIFRWLTGNGVPVLVVATKADKLGRGARKKQTDRIRLVLGVPELDILPYSSLKNEGRSELLDVIADSL